MPFGRPLMRLVTLLYRRRRWAVQGRGPERAGPAVRPDLRAPGPAPVTVTDPRAPGPAQVAGSRAPQFVLPDEGREDGCVKDQQLGKLQAGQYLSLLSSLIVILEESFIALEKCYLRNIGLSSCRVLNLLLNLQLHV